LFQGAWALVLNQYSGDADVVFGVTVSGRSAPLVDMESRIGLFINTLPLRVKVTPDIPWLTWLQNIMQEQINLEQHVYTSKELLKRCSETSSDQPLFYSNLRFQNYPAKEADMPANNEFDLIDILNVDWWHYPLNLIIVPGLRVKLFITYDERFLAADTIREILDQLESTLTRFTIAALDDDLEVILQC
jgi:non-ribosomal peptide synthetase component F